MRFRSQSPMGWGNLQSSWYRLSCNINRVTQRYLSIERKTFSSTDLKNFLECFQVEPCFSWIDQIAPALKTPMGGKPSVVYPGGWQWVQLGRKPGKAYWVLSITKDPRDWVSLELTLQTVEITWIGRLLLLGMRDIIKARVMGAEGNSCGAEEPHPQRRQNNTS